MKDAIAKNVNVLQINRIDKLSVSKGPGEETKEQQADQDLLAQQIILYRGSSQIYTFYVCIGIKLADISWFILKHPLANKCLLFLGFRVKR